MGDLGMGQSPVLRRARLPGKAERVEILQSGELASASVGLTPRVRHLSQWTPCFLHRKYFGGSTPRPCKYFPHKLHL